ncbi:hypothetical protein HYE30_00875 [Mycoplasmopsis bovis]|nr:hypothetical protein [Mycoplasmopsis bovis]QQH22452.1 hypothetical protein HYE30_00875 [Mycoplasmopsis bovis]
MIKFSSNSIDNSNSAILNNSAKYKAFFLSIATTIRGLQVFQALSSETLDISDEL